MKPNAVLRLATGSTPEGLHAQLIDWHQKDLDSREGHSSILDEYYGLSPGKRTELPPLS